MSERSLVLKCAAAGRYVIQATDFPVARVFDTSSSTLVATLELPRRQRSSLSTVTLTAVGIGLLGSELKHQNESASHRNKDSKLQSTHNIVDDESSIEVLQSCYAAAGLSNGTLLLHDVTRNKLLSYIALSPMQRGVQAISFCGAFVFALCNDGKVYGVNVCAHERGVCALIDAGKDVHAIASTLVNSSSSAEEAETADSKFATSSNLYDSTTSTSIRIMTCGTSVTLYECNLLAHNVNAHFNVNDKHSNQIRVTDWSHALNTLPFHKIVSFAAHGAPADYAWVSAAALCNTTTSPHVLRNALLSEEHNIATLHHGNADTHGITDDKSSKAHRAHIFTSHTTHPIGALTANAEEGVLRLWDVQPAQSQTLRCRRTLLCGQRIAQVQVLEYQHNLHQHEVEISNEENEMNTSLTASTENHNQVANMKSKSVVRGVVIATTFTGSVLIWDFTNKTGLLPSVVEPLPISPTLVLTCSVPAGRLLFAAASVSANVMKGIASKAITHNENEEKVNTHDDNDAEFNMHNISLLFLRGRFALPHFDMYNLDELIQYNKKYYRTSSSARLPSDDISAQNGEKAIETQSPENVTTKATTTTTTTETKRLQQKQEMMVARRLAMLGFGAEVQVVDVPTSDVAWSMNLLNKSRTAHSLYATHQMNNVNTNYNNYNGEANVSLLSSDATFHVMDNVWATYRTKLATRAMYAASESFPLAHSIHASSIRDLPTGEETLEQRLRALQLAASNATTTQAILSRRQHTNNEISTKINGKSSAINSNNTQDNEADSATTSQQHETATHNATHADDDRTVQHTDNVTQKYSGALGLATIPLYQALHANDAAAIMELLSISSHSIDEMRATVMSLQLPYCLQLIRVLSERLGICTGKMAIPVMESDNDVRKSQKHNDNRQDGHNEGNASNNVRSHNYNNDNQLVKVDTNTSNVKNSTHDRLSQEVSVHNDNNKNNNNNNNYKEKGQSAKVVTVGEGSAAIAVHAPMLRWFNVILQCRGIELYELQRQMNATSTNKTTMTNQMTSPPKDFIAPLLQQYRNMCALHDKLAMLHGRLSIFNSIRPQERQNFFNAPGNMSTSNMESGYLLHSHQNKHATTQSRSKRGTHMSKRVISTLRDDVLFPRMFTEVRSRTNGPYVVRVRSRLASKEKKKQMQLKSVSFVRERAKQLALRKLNKIQDETIDDTLIDDNDFGERHNMENVDGSDVDLDALENMNLNESDAEEDHSENEEDEYESDDNGSALSEDDIIVGGQPRRIAKTNLRSAKIVRVAADEMIPDMEDNLADDEVVQSRNSATHTKRKTANSSNSMNEFASEFGVDHAMNEAEFSSESDDEIDSEVEDNSTDESSSDDNDDDDDNASDANNDEEDSNDNDALYDNDEDDGSDNEDGGSSEDENEMSGIGEDMQSLLSTYDTAEDEAEKRKTKRVRTDERAEARELK